MNKRDVGLCQGEIYLPAPMTQCVVEDTKNRAEDSVGLCLQLCDVYYQNTNSTFALGTDFTVGSGFSQCRIGGEAPDTQCASGFSGLLVYVFIFTNCAGASLLKYTPTPPPAQEQLGEGSKLCVTKKYITFWSSRNCSTGDLSPPYMNPSARSKREVQAKVTFQVLCGLHELNLLY